MEFDTIVVFVWCVCVLHLCVVFVRCICVVCLCGVFCGMVLYVCFILCGAMFFWGVVCLCGMVYLDPGHLPTGHFPPNIYPFAC